MFDQPNEKPASVSISIEDKKCEERFAKIKSLIKQSFKSRLAKCQLILLILNVIGIVTIIILACVLSKNFHRENQTSSQGMLIIRFVLSDNLFLF